MSRSADDPAAAGSRSCFSEKQLALMAELEEELAIPDTKPRVVHPPDVQSETRVVHLPKVLTASETLAVVSGAEDAHRFQIKNWCDPEDHLFAKSGTEGYLPLLIKIPANCPVVITQDSHGQYCIVICLGDTS